MLRRLTALTAGVALGCGTWLILSTNRRAEPIRPAAAVTQAPSPIDFSGVARACGFGYAGQDALTVEDGGATLLVDDLPLDALTCVLNTVDAPARVQQHIRNTRMIDGQQEDYWPGLGARWTYAPSTGLELTIFKEEQR